jgi:hypothetical protein
MPGKKWSVERERELIELWADSSLSASQIAKRMGVFASAKDGGRSSILGKVMRLGLPHRKLKQTPEELAQAKADRIAAKRQHELVRQQALAAEREQKRISDAFTKLLKVERINEERKQSSTPFNDLRMFSQRTSNQCRFMLNDAAPFIACGAVTPPGESWCLHCREVVMAKPAPILSDEERFRRAMAFKKNALSRTMTSMPTARDQAA